MVLRVVAVLAGLWLAAEVSAQAPAPAIANTAEPPVGPPAVGDEVIVRGRRMSEIESGLRIEVDRFVMGVAAPAPGRGYARWQRSVCISVQNLEQKAAQYLVDRISRLAADVGLEPGEPGCSPNVVVAFTVDGKQAARRLVDEQPDVLRPGLEGVQRGLEALHEFAESDKPVRWWHVSMPVEARSGTPAINTRRDEPSTAPSVTVEGPSRIHSGVRDDLVYAIIIVDGPKLRGKGTTWEQLGDYLALVSLAQIDFSAQPSGFDSILNLFSNPKAYSGLTDWDRAYVRALYRFDQERDPRMQRNELVNAMVRQAR